MLVEKAQAVRREFYVHYYLFGFKKLKKRVGGIMSYKILQSDVFEQIQSLIFSTSWQRDP